MSTARLLATTIVAVFTATATVLGLAWALALPLVDERIDARVAPIEREFRVAETWRMQHQAYVEYGQQRMAAEAQSRQQELAEIKSELRYIRERLDALYGRR
jgi:F0F1-type ATP synthase membrane subunit b/b'